MKKTKRLFISAVILLFMVALSILLMPYSSDRAINGDKTMMYILGGTFWACLLIGYMIVILLHSGARKNKKSTVKLRSGLFVFFRNPLAKIFDSLLILSIILFALSLWLLDTSSYIICLLLALSFFTGNMHCLFNSNMYDAMISGVKKEKQ